MSSKNYLQNNKTMIRVIDSHKFEIISAKLLSRAQIAPILKKLNIGEHWTDQYFNLFDSKYHTIITIK